MPGVEVGDQWNPSHGVYMKGIEHLDCHRTRLVGVGSWRVWFQRSASNSNETLQLFTALNSAWINGRLVLLHGFLRSLMDNGYIEIFRYTIQCLASLPRGRRRRYKWR